MNSETTTLDEETLLAQEDNANNFTESNKPDHWPCSKKHDSYEIHDCCRKHARTIDAKIRIYLFSKNLLICPKCSDLIEKVNEPKVGNHGISGPDSDSCKANVCTIC